MKTIIIAFSISFFFLSFANGEIVTKTIITGKIKSEKPLTIKKISFRFPDYLKLVRKIPAKVDSLGNFRVEVLLSNPTDFNLDFGNNLKQIRMFASPGDSIFLEINENLFQSRFNLEDFYSNVVVKGPSQKINNDIAKFIIGHYQVLDWKQEEEAIFKLNPQQFKSYIEKRGIQLNSYLIKFNKKQQTCDEFKIWANNYIKYWSFDNLTDYVSTYPMFNKLNKDSFIKALPKDYFSYLIGLDDQNKNVEISSTFYDFMENLYKKNIIESSFGLDEHAPNYSLDLFASFNKSISQFQNQNLKDILLAKFYFKALKSDNFKNVNSIYQPDLIKDSTLNMQIRNLYNDKYKN